MSRNRANSAELLRDELTCPQCNYPLRGLAGETVICPECGTSCDITLMMTRQWSQPWHQAPGFTKLMMPLTWLLASVVVWPIPAVIEANIRNEAPAGSILLGPPVIFIVWILLLRSLRDVAGRGKGWKLALLAHGLFIGYIGGIVAIVWLVVAAFGVGHVVLSPILLVLTAVPMAWFWQMRRGEKYIASECIKAWLNRPEDRRVEFAAS